MPPSRTSQSPVEVAIELAEHFDPEQSAQVRRRTLAEGAGDRIALGTSALPGLAQHLHTNIATGLSAADVSQKLLEFGYNLLQEAKPKPFLYILLGQVNVLNMVVFGAGLLTIVGPGGPDWMNGCILWFIVLACMTIGAFMEWQCNQMMASMASMVAPSCKVIRDSCEQVIDFASVVPGDIIVLAAGDVIPADCRVIKTLDMTTNEMALTGEPHDIMKTIEPLDPTSPFPSNMMYALTSVVEGSGVALVVKTGMSTEIGKVAESLKSEGLGLSSVQKTLNQIGFMVTIAVIVLCGSIFCFSFFMRVDDPAEPCGKNGPTMCFFEKSMMRAVFDAVGAIPETLQPACLFLLVMGCRQLKNKNATTRSLPAVDTIGACSYICSDKTGTLTEGKMTCMRLNPRVRPSSGSNNAAKRFAFYPTRGFDPLGGIFDAEALNTEAKWRLDVVQDQAALGNVIPDFGNPQNASVDAKLVRSFMMALHLNSYSTELVLLDGAYTVKGNMSEGALVVGSAKARLVGNKFHQQYQRDPNLEVPFSSSRKMAVTVHKIKGGTFEALRFDDAHTHIAIVKGAPDVILPHLKFALAAGAKGEFVPDSRPFDAEDKAWFQQENSTLSSQALRVLCAAVQPLTSSEVNQLRACESPDSRLAALMKGPLTLLGVVGLMDPVRPSAKAAIELSHAAGMRVAMITGDQQQTAVAIAKELGIVRPGMDESKTVSECAALRDRSQWEVDELCNKVVVWSRAQPADKVTIVESLQRQGHVVAMTGDGMNDAGALKKSDIGLAMGIAGSDITKSAADMVLLDDRFATIVDAVDEGRKIFANIQRMTMYLLCVNVFEVIVLLAVMLLGWVIPCEDEQLFFANLVTHEFYPWCMVIEAAFSFQMKRPPYSKKSPLIPPLMRNVLVAGIFVLYCSTLIFAQLAGSYLYQGGPQMSRSMGTNNLVEFNTHEFNCFFANRWNYDEETDGDTKTKTLELIQDAAPIYCKMTKWTTGGWTEFEEWGTGEKEEDDDALKDYNTWTGSFDKLFKDNTQIMADDKQKFGEAWNTTLLDTCDKVKTPADWKELAPHKDLQNGEPFQAKDHLCWVFKKDAEGVITDKMQWDEDEKADESEQETKKAKENPEDLPKAVIEVHNKVAALQMTELTKDADCSTEHIAHRRLRAGRKKSLPMALLQLQKTSQELKSRTPHFEHDEEPSHKMPVLYRQYNINAWGTRQMRSVFLMTMLMSEALLLLALSKHDVALPLLLQNPSFVMAWVPMTALASFYLFSPPTFMDWDYAPPNVVSFAIAVGFAVTFYCLLEGVKFVYRQLFKAELDREIITCSLLADGALPAFTHHTVAQRLEPLRWQTTAEKLGRNNA